MYFQNILLLYNFNCLYYFQLIKVIEALNDQLTKKGIEINEYKEKHNIRIRGQDDLQHPEEESKEAKRNAIVVNPIEV